MFKFLEKLVNQPTAAKQIDEKDLMVATAGLFLEIIQADFKIDPQEESQLRRLLENRFALTDSDLNALLAFARQDREKRQDIWQFASRLKDHLPRERRIGILRDLWRLIYADGRLDMYEEATIRKMTELLGLDHADMIEAKLAVKREG